MAISLNQLFGQGLPSQVQTPTMANILTGLGQSMTNPVRQQQASALPLMQLLSGPVGGAAPTQVNPIQQFAAPQYTAQDIDPLKTSAFQTLMNLFDTSGYDTPAVSQTPEPSKQDTSKNPSKGTPTVAEKAAQQVAQQAQIQATQQQAQTPAQQQQGAGASPIASILSSIPGLSSQAEGAAPEAPAKELSWYERPEVISALAQFGNAAGQGRSAGEALGSAAMAYVGTKQAQSKAEADAEEKKYQRANDAYDRAIKGLDAETRAKVANSTIALNKVKAETEQAGLDLKPAQLRLLEAKIKTEAARAAKLNRADSEGGDSSLIKPKDYASLMVQVGRDLYVEDPLEKRAIVNSALPPGARQYEPLTEDAITDLQATLTDPELPKADKQKAINRAILIYGPDATITK